MPTLNWIGKEKVVNHHLDVPFRVLEHQYGFTEKGEQPQATNSGNKIIHGDNLEALKALLPEYEGKIKCIYIDPPYNTGNIGWMYNDNVNHPRISKWLEKTVGREGEDLARHDKWLCMMYPRLKLLHRLLARDGAIFVSIDDNEMAHLNLLMNEIFGASNHLGTFCWKRRSSSSLADKYLSIDHEYVLCYQKGNFESFKGLGKTYANYKNPNNDPRGDWMLDNLTVGMDREMRPNQFYDLVDPATGNVFKPNPNRVWAYIPESMNRMIEQGRIFFPADTSKKPMLKRYKSDLKDTHNPISSFLPSSSTTSKNEHSISLNSVATKELQAMFDSKIFDYSKPRDLVAFFIDQTTNAGDIVLDSFAGSGTTAHAVLDLNRDGGHRKFILIEMEDYATTVTSERVRRAIQGYADMEGTGGSFDFLQLGNTVFTESGELNELAGAENIRRYVWYTETRTPYQRPDSTNEYLLGVFEDAVYYFYYDQDGTTEIDYGFLSTLDPSFRGEQYIIYADNCLLPVELMRSKNIVFKKIPRDITKF